MPPAIAASFFVDVTNTSTGVPGNHLSTSKQDKPDANAELEYVAEGAANVIWSLGTSPSLNGKLLRLRKGTWSGEGSGPPVKAKRPPPFISSAEVLDHFSKQVQPLFQPNQIVEQELVHINRDLINRCNEHLDSMEHTGLRPRERYHWHIKHEERSGMLITSMLPTSQGSVLFHLKPKWLTQSPTAPPNARRCRTCALAAKRGTDPTQTICSLALYSSDETAIRQQIERLVGGDALLFPNEVAPQLTKDITLPEPQSNATKTQPIIKKLTNLFLPGQQAHALLERLRTLQQQYDPTGVLNLNPGADTSDLAMAMTLRDATMFVKLSFEGVDVRLGDLDPKSGDSEHKFQQWCDIEEGLIKNGWYTGTEEVHKRKGREIHTSCFLWNR